MKSATIFKKRYRPRDATSPAGDMLAKGARHNCILEDMNAGEGFPLRNN